MTEIECVVQPFGRKFCKPSPCLVFAMLCEAMFLDLVSSVYYLRDTLQRPEVSPRSFKLIYTKEWHERYHSFKLPGRGNFVQHLLLNWSDVKFGHDYNVFNTETAGRFVEGYLAWLMVSDADSGDWSEAKHALATAWLRTIDALLAVLNHIYTTMPRLYTRIKATTTMEEVWELLQEGLGSVRLKTLSRVTLGARRPPKRGSLTCANAGRE